MLKLIFFLHITILTTISAEACLKELGSNGIVPENNLSIPYGPGFETGISKKQFDRAIDRVEKLYAPVIAKMGDRLDIKRKWFDGTVNAYAEKKGHRRIVEMFGGFARHPLTTEDVFTFVVCHEVGHHVGGEPMIHSMKELWASNEGQSDYFAGTKCLRKVFINDDNEKIMANVEVPTIVKDKCAIAFDTANERAMCERIAMAGFGLASIFTSLRNSEPISFETPDPKVVWRTWFLHPIPQCRLDTYFSSAICPVGHQIDPDYKDETVGFCARINHQDEGARPRCWYAPKGKHEKSI